MDEVEMKGRMEKRVLTIVVSYNFEPWLARCLDSLSGSAYPTDIMVVDNGSADRTVEIIRECYPAVRLVQNGANLGFGAANNIGFREALSGGYDAVFLVNQDAWVAPDTIGTLAALWQRHPEYGILSPVHWDGSGSRLDQGFAAYASVSGRESLPVAEEVVACAFINAAFWFVPCAVVEEVGGFSPLFRHYGEDKDFVNRLHWHHYRVGYSPKASGCHDRGDRPASRAAVFRAEYVYHLSEYANVNYPAAKAFAYGVLAVAKKSAKAFCRRRWQDASEYWRMAGRLLRLSPEVREQRRRAKRKLSNIGLS